MFVGAVLIAVPHQIISTLSSGSDDDYYHSLRELRRACGIHGVLPTSFKLPHGLTLVMPNSMERPFASGGFSDVWKARDDKGEIFAVKHFRTYRGDSLMYVKKVFLVCRPAFQYFSRVPFSRNTVKRQSSPGGQDTKTF